MDQLSLTPAKNSQPQVLSVSDVNKAVRSTIEGGFPLLWIKGEISNFKPHSSGHWYLSLKDAKSQINAVMFRGFNQSVRFKPTDGMEVIVRGKLTVYEPRGNYQIFCEMMEPVGAGALQMAFEKLKAKLAAEGLFAKEKKRVLPAMPQHLGVVTSPTGAAIRDILQILRRRFPGLKVTLIPAVVQGNQAAASIVSAIELANRIEDIDVLIVGRGGGSVEDMWCFNEEAVARAIANSRIPTISAVGHEIDFTIADFVADVRAPTPSAAAELVVKSAEELTEQLSLHLRHLSQIMQNQLALAKRHWLNLKSRLVDPKRRLGDLILRCDELSGRLSLSIERVFRDKRQQIEILSQRLEHPQNKIDLLRQKLSEYEIRLDGLMQIYLERMQARHKQAAAMLDNLSPLKVLDRGYAIATHQSQVVRELKGLKIGEPMSVRVAGGIIETEIKKLTKENP